jgi:hypothetical protein
MHAPLSANAFQSQQPIGDNSLPALAASIAAAHRAHHASAVESAASAIEAGGLLIEAKALVAHGEWAAWLLANVGFSERTARRYMQLARSGIKAATVAEVGLRGALECLARGAAWIDAPGTETEVFESAACDYRRPCGFIAPTGDGRFDLAVLTDDAIVTLPGPVPRGVVLKALLVMSGGALTVRSHRRATRAGAFAFLMDLSKIEARDGKEAALPWGKAVVSGCMGCLVDRLDAEATR